MRDEDAIRNAKKEQNLRNYQKLNQRQVHNVDSLPDLNDNVQQLPSTNRDLKNLSDSYKQIQSSKNKSANKNDINNGITSSNSNTPNLPRKNINTGNNKFNNISNRIGKNLKNSGFKGKNAQKSLNDLNSGGIKNRISNAKSKGGGFANTLFGSAKSNKSHGALLPFGSQSELDTKDQLDEQSTTQGLANLKISRKAIIATSLIFVASFIIVIFPILMISASQAYLNAVGLGQADDITQDKALEKIEQIFGNEEKITEEIDDVSFVFDVYVQETNQDLGHYEFSAKKVNEIDSDDLENEDSLISELKDFYPDIVKYDNDDYDKSDVYKFFVKLYNVYHYYYGQGVKLDMPLIMSVLSLQSTNMNEVFKLNTVDYDKSAIDQGTNNPDFDINKNWSNYKSTRSNSSHDIEVLAQAMVKEGSSSSDDEDGNYVDGIEFMTGGIGDIYYFNQLDYADKPYGVYGTIASHGCGPTALSIVISSFLKEVHDPVELTNYVCEHGGCSNAGSAWSSIETTPPNYGLKSRRTMNQQEIVSALGSGNSLVIGIMCPGHFTSGGHFIVLTETNSNGQVKVADPASRDRSTFWSFNTVYEETCGAFWIISK